MGRVLPQPLAARQRRPQHAWRQLHRRLLLGGLRQGRHRHLGDAGRPTTRCSSASLPPYEPRGCQRGISASWYVYSPIRVKYPYIRGALLDLWREAQAAALRSGGGLGLAGRGRTEARAHPAGPRQGRLSPRQLGRGCSRSSPPPACTRRASGGRTGSSASRRSRRCRILSYAAGSRFLQLFGGVNMSFYDWYADLPNAFPEVWGDQTDVCESADWYNSKYIVSMGVEPEHDAHPRRPLHRRGAHTRAPSSSCSRRTSARSPSTPTGGSRSRRARTRRSGWRSTTSSSRSSTSSARSRTSSDYLKRYTDCPFLVELERDGGRAIAPGQLLRANRSAATQDVENGDWKMLVWDATSGEPRMPKGTVGFRWGEGEGQVEPVSSRTGWTTAPIDPVLTLHRANAMPWSRSRFDEFANGRRTISRGVPVRRIADRRTAR